MKRKMEKVTGFSRDSILIHHFRAFRVLIHEAKVISRYFKMRNALPRAQLASAFCPVQKPVTGPVSCFYTPVLKPV
jgi:hypothetical protein